MKTFRKILSFLSILAVTASFSSSAVSETSQDVRYQRLADEASRNREMIEIWKEHVRVLTKERDELTKKLEEMKTGSAASVPAAEEGPTSEEFEKVSREKEAAIRRIKDLEKELAAARTNPGQAMLQKELDETRNDKDIILREKEEALAKTASLQREHDKLRAENERLKTGPPVAVKPVQTVSTPAPSAELEKMKVQLKLLQSENASLRSQMDRFRNLGSASTASADPERRVRELELKNAALQARSDKLMIVEKELSEARSYFASLTDELEAKNKRLTAELDRLKSGAPAAVINRQAEEEHAAIEKELRSRISQAEKELSAARDQNDALRSQIQQLEFSVRDLSRNKPQGESLVKAQTDLAAKNSLLEQKIKSLQKENKDNNEMIGDLQTELSQLKGRSADTRALSSELADLRVSRDGLQKERDELARQVQALKFQIEKAETKSSRARELEDWLDKQKSEKDALQRRYDLLDQKARELEERAASLGAAKEEAEKRAQSFAENLRGLQAQGAKFNELQEELAKEKSVRRIFQQEKEELARKINDLEAQNQTFAARSQKLSVVEAELKETQTYLSAKIQALEESSQKMKDDVALTNAQKDEAVRLRLASEERMNDLKSELERLRARLAANAADIKNLRENFDAMMEPLVSDFDKRK